jgi:protein-tyrosine phosphatase
MPSILFICTANLYRSPLAAALLHTKVKGLKDRENWKIDSAGTWTKNGLAIHSQTITDASALGLDVTRHKSKQVTAELLSSYDLVLVMESGQKEALSLEFPDQSGKIYLLSEVVDGISYNINDPFSPEGIHDRDVVDDLDKLISRGTEKILALAKTLSSINSR